MVVLRNKPIIFDVLSHHFMAGTKWDCELLVLLELGLQSQPSSGFVERPDRRDS